LMTFVRCLFGWMIFILIIHISQKIMGTKNAFYSHLEAVFLEHGLSWKGPQD